MVPAARVTLLALPEAEAEAEEAAEASAYPVAVAQAETVQHSPLPATLGLLEPLTAVQVEAEEAVEVLPLLLHLLAARVEPVALGL